MNKLRTCVHHGTTYKAHPCKKTPRLPGLTFSLIVLTVAQKPRTEFRGPRGLVGVGTTTLGLKSSHLGDVSLLLSLKRDRKNKHIAVLCKFPAIGSPLFFIFSWGRVRRRGTVVSWYFVLARNPSSPSSPPPYVQGGNHPLVKPRREAWGSDSGDDARFPPPPPTPPHPHSNPLYQCPVLLTSALTSQHYGCYT